MGCWGTVVSRDKVAGTSSCRHGLFGVGGSDSSSDPGSESGRLPVSGLSVLSTMERIQGQLWVCVCVGGGVRGMQYMSMHLAHYSPLALGTKSYAWGS